MFYINVNNDLKNISYFFVFLNNEKALIRGLLCLTTKRLSGFYIRIYTDINYFVNINGSD